MVRDTFNRFFEVATNHEPFDFQQRLAGGDSGRDCVSQLINIPTGLGKTAAVVMAWLWNRVVHLNETHRSTWPRRLVYCLPMRTLVEQTEREIKKWLATLHDEADRLRFSEDAQQQLEWLAHHSPIILMGGEEADSEWDIWPEKAAILIGTQDMLLSRALNRGYGMSRYGWPMHFGLLNNDCLWVMDETQLMGVSVETSAQLDGFRHEEKRPVFGNCPTWWMSATLEDARLATVDHPKPEGGWPCLELSKEEKEKPGSRPKALFEAKKAVSRCELTLSQTSKGDHYAKQIAALIAERHRALLEKPLENGTLTLVVVNRVERAQKIYAAVTTPDKKTKQPLYDPARVALVHSRFRRMDRRRHEELLFGSGDRIVIATQAVEAGVDVSARLLITELAPWSSLVQRIGRCNRRAEFSDAEVLWIDIKPKDDGDDLLRPYRKDDLDKARKELTNLVDASPRSLGGITVAETPVVRPVIRRRDLIDLFDTTPDICGQDLDISRYVRDEHDNDVQFFWRDREDDVPLQNEPPPERDELCRVSIGGAVKFFGKEKTEAWQWNPLERKWQSVTKPRPGAVYLIAASSGGYEDDLGWTGEPTTKKLTTNRPPERDNEAYDSDPDTFVRAWQELAEHAGQVVAEMENLATALALDAEKATLHTAALWHDVGKAHNEFQAMLRNGDASREDTLWAKSADKGGKCSRHGFRHELASALAWLLAGPTDAPERDLVAYLIAAHHGKVRLSIRSLPEEQGNPEDPEALFARGLWDGDKLPAVQLGDITVPETTLDLSFMKMGEGPHGPSWLARAISLRDRLGPFRLAYLETLLRSADARASATKTQTPNDR